MWKFLVRLNLRNRTWVLIGIAAITVFFAWQAFKVKMSYDYARMLPAHDPVSVGYDNFKKQFGEDGSVLMLGVENPDMFEMHEFNEWIELGNDIKKLDGIEEVASVARAITVTKNDSLRKFEFHPLVTGTFSSQAEVDSVKELVHSLKFYEGLLYNPNTDVYLMAITLNKNKVNDKSRIALVNQIKERAEQYHAKTKHEVHYSGMPYIRTFMMLKIQHELYLFVFLSILVAAIIFFLFFRSLKMVATSLVVVVISVVWALGLLGLLGFKVTILTGVIPSLIVIIAIENCIYVLNKYHWEYRQHGNKVKALSRTIQRIGYASLMVNTATAIGFGAFMMVSNQMLRQFGIVASLCVLLEYALCITLVPVLFSYMAPPTEKQLKHLDNKSLKGILDKILFLVQNKRKMIYWISGLLIVVGLVGVFQLKTSGKVVDDIRTDDPIYKDLKFFERNFGGVMPFEVMIDTKKKNGVMRMQTIKKIDELQQAVAGQKVFSKPLSVAELAKFAKQAYFNGNPERYELPNAQEQSFVLSYFPRKAEGKTNILKSFIDSNQQRTRVTFQMQDLPTKELHAMLDSLTPKVDSIFPKDSYEVSITGNSVVYAKGTDYLIKHLIISVLIAVVLISLLMALMFSSLRMVILSMLPNMVPLLITAAIMGFCNIPIKPSTIIVFSIALGISVDNAIQYLARYRFELKACKNIKQATLAALRETGYSMIYTSIVLVLCFSVFITSSFGGTQALGILVSSCLFIAMFFNVAVLPSLLLSLNKRVVTKSFEQEPIIEVSEEIETDDEEIELK